ncbi:hypothetical protein PL9631_500037 [Planktothrix paucivesiculata PCC 9631]|uniref:Uncharacterized protein n=1 Tax=Planktothrix paucivesiculata PCC 9631 TaxID=671071 RepID=A0A7Z9E0V4_9CYAN|nr:hypothetical protein PL9631_500037 [Planktothrix paucivesiculata PCC 9631]
MSASTLSDNKADVIDKPAKKREPTNKFANRLDFTTLTAYIL